jgi:hypothetical protein
VLEWQYQASGINKIRVVVDPDDRLVLDALVGSCVECVSMGKNANTFTEIQNGLLTLGLIIRHLTKQPDVAGAPTPPVSTKWTVSVGHAFAFRVGLVDPSLSLTLYDPSRHMLYSC